MKAEIIGIPCSPLSWDSQRAPFLWPSWSVDPPPFDQEPMIAKQSVSINNIIQHISSFKYFKLLISYVTLTQAVHQTPFYFKWFFYLHIIIHTNINTTRNTQHFPHPRATTAACDVIPLLAVKIPAAVFDVIPHLVCFRPCLHSYK